MPEQTGAIAETTQAPSQAESGASQVYDHRIGESQEPASAQDDSGQQQQQGNGQKPEPKKESRYQRTRRERAAFRAQKEAFERERQAFMLERTRAQQQAQTHKDSYTIEDIRKYLPAWREAAQAEPWNAEKQQLVETAQKELERLEALEQAERKARTVEWPASGTPEFKAEWERAEMELAQADSAFMRAGTTLDTKLREIMAGPDGNIYRQHPRGIVAAYHRARMELLEADMKGLQTENSKLKDELKRYQGYTSVGAGAPARVGTGSRVESIGDFERLSTKDMRKHLLANANKHAVPWF